MLNKTYRILCIVSLFLLLLFLINPKAQANSIFSKYQNNPILSPTTNSWDNLYVWQPSVIYNGNEFKMYYTGYNGSKYQIGLAHSIDGVNWSKDTSNPVVSRISLDNKNSHDPTVLFNGNSYEMWYASLNSGNFGIYRAVSSNGNVWTNDPIEPVFKPTQGWGSGAISSPYVLKINSEYKMWFSSPDTGRWSIGLATSPDGITWTQYASNPVLIPDKPWEGDQVDGS